MTRDKNSALLKIFILGPYLVVLYILQSTVFTHLALFGVKPMLLPLAVAGVALFRGISDGGVFGLFAGMLMDLAYNQNTVEFTLILTAAGILLGLLSDTVLAQGFPSFLLTCLMALALCSGAQIFVLAVLRGAPFAQLIGTAVWQSVYSLIFSLPFYYISRFLCRVM